MKSLMMIQVNNNLLDYKLIYHVFEFEIEIVIYKLHIQLLSMINKLSIN